MSKIDENNMDESIIKQLCNVGLLYYYFFKFQFDNVLIFN